MPVTKIPPPKPPTLQALVESFSPEQVEALRIVLFCPGMVLALKRALDVHPATFAHPQYPAKLASMMRSRGFSRAEIREAVEIERGGGGGWHDAR